MKKLLLILTEPTQWDLFVQKCKITYQMFTSESFVLINKTTDHHKGTKRMDVVGFGMTMQDVTETTNKAYIESINVSYRDVSFANKIIKQLHGHDGLTLSN